MGRNGRKKQNLFKEKHTTHSIAHITYTHKTSSKTKEGKNTHTHTIVEWEWKKTAPTKNAKQRVNNRNKTVSGDRAEWMDG